MATVTKNKKRATTTTRRTSSVVSIENGIRILKNAIKRKSSLSAASTADGRGKNYISDIKARLEENYKSKNISRELFNEFNSLRKQYEKTVK